MVNFRDNDQLSSVLARASEHLAPRSDWQARVFSQVRRQSSKPTRSKRRWWMLVVTESVLVCALSLMVVVGNRHTMSMADEITAMRAQNVELVNQLSDGDSDVWFGDGKCECPTEQRIMQCGFSESTAATP